MPSIALRMLALAPIALATACGGGGSGGSGDPNRPPPPPPVLSINANNAEAVGFAVLATSEFALGIADEAAYALQTIDGTALYASSARCSLGAVAYALQDADGDSALSAGDTVTATFTDCLSTATDGVLNGSLSIAVTLVDDNRGADDVAYDFNANSSGLSALGNGSVTRSLNGGLDVTFRRGVYNASLSVTGSPQYNSTGTQMASVTWSTMRASKSENYETARYEIQISGSVSSDLYDGTATVGTTIPFTGYLNTFPLDGELEATGGDASRMFLGLSVTIPDNYSIYVDTAGSGVFTELFAGKPWNFTTAGYLWWFEPSSPDLFDIRMNDPDDFRILTRRPYARFNVFSEIASVNPQIRLQASRPVDPATVTPDLRLKLAPQRYPTTSVLIDLDVEVRGALVILRPVEQLAPGTRYRLDNLGIEFLDFAGNRASIGSFDFSFDVDDPVRAIVTPWEGYLVAGDSTDLDASASTAEDDGTVTFSWSQALGTAATITNGDTALATVTAPPVAVPELVRLNAVATNEFGESDVGLVDLSVFPDASSVNLVVMRGVTGDGAREESLYSAVNGDHTIEYNGNDYLEIENETIYFVEDQNGSQTLFRRNLRLNFDSGGPNQPPPLTVGEYTYDRNVIGGPDIRVRGDAGCFGPAGTFNVIEFEFDANDVVQKLAVDYTLDCDSGYEHTAVSGHVRYRSDVPVPDAG